MPIQNTSKCWLLVDVLASAYDTMMRSTPAAMPATVTPTAGSLLGGGVRGDRPGWASDENEADPSEDRSSASGASTPIAGGPTAESIPGSRSEVTSCPPDPRRSMLSEEACALDARGRGPQGIHGRRYVGCGCCRGRNLTFTFW